MTVLLPVGKDITVTFSLLGDSVHDGNSGDTHTLADDNLEKWIDSVSSDRQQQRHRAGC